jgi:hypothetical protein
VYHVKICNNQMVQSGASKYDKNIYRYTFFSSELGSRNTLTLLPQTVLNVPLANAFSRLSGQAYIFLLHFLYRVRNKEMLYRHCFSNLLANGSLRRDRQTRKDIKWMGPISFWSTVIVFVYGET